MISELKVCQEANAKNHPDWGKGYVGGAPNSQQPGAIFFRKAIFSSLLLGLGAVGQRA
ncbi:MAG: hypothetical protein IPF54_28130 [Draconibacterium sp.]|nr:hypothetical protein [Draconibacterium sp.]